MNKRTALQLIWDYMHMHQKLKKADAIFVLGNRDVRVGEYAAQLWLAVVAIISSIVGAVKLKHYYSTKS